MSDLIRLKDFVDLSITELALNISSSVSASREELQRRFYPGAIRRFGTNYLTTRDQVERAFIEDTHGDLHINGKATYGVVDWRRKGHDGVVIGLATAIVGLDIYRQRIPVQPRYIDRLPMDWLRTKVDIGEVNVSGWVIPEAQDQLGDVYRQLVEQVRTNYAASTMEPVRSNLAIHAAIQSAGLNTYGAPQRYDVGEDRGIIPPVSQAYLI